MIILVENIEVERFLLLSSLSLASENWKFVWLPIFQLVSETFRYYADKMGGEKGV